MVEAIAASGITLDVQEMWHKWYEAIKGGILQDLQEYFDPDDNKAFEKPVLVTIGDIKEKATVLAQLTSGEKTLYAQLKTNYKDDLVQYQQYLKEKVKLQTELRRIISPAKRGFLKDRLTTREWLEALRTIIKLNDIYIIGVVKAKHRVFIGSKYQEQFIRGPEKWFQEWQALFSLCEIWSKVQYNEWVIDFTLVQGEVPDIKRLYKDFKQAMKMDNINGWTIYKVSVAL